MLHRVCDSCSLRREIRPTSSRQQTCSTREMSLSHSSLQLPFLQYMVDGIKLCSIEKSKTSTCVAVGISGSRVRRSKRSPVWYGETPRASLQLHFLFPPS